MATPTNAALPLARSERRTRTALVLESIALRHQIAVLERSGTRRPCFRFRDRLFWLLLMRWWSGWRDSLVIVQPATVLRWRRSFWSELWRYRSRGRWRGGRPRVSRELRQLIVRMAGENFLWGAPRIHGELLMLGFTVSQATVSRYMPAANRRRSQSWRTFIGNQALAFRRDQDFKDESIGDDAGLCALSYWGRPIRFAARHLALVGGRPTYDCGYPRPALNAQVIAPRSVQHERDVSHQAWRLSGVSRCWWQAVSDRAPVAVSIRSPPDYARAS
jgi:hypothetical protein